MNNIMTEYEILEQENKLYKAIKENNLTMLDKLLHDDLLFIIPTGEVLTKPMDLKMYQDGTLQIDELAPKVENLHIVADVAIITLTMKLKGKFNKEVFEANYRYIRFWKKFEGCIKVIGGSGIAI